MTSTITGILAATFLGGATLAFAAEPAKAPAAAPPAAKPAATAASAPAAKPASAPAAAAAPAAKPAAAPAVNAGPTPAPELDMLFKGFEGNWKCDTTMAPGALGPDSPETKLKANVKIAKARDLGGFWYRGDYEIKKTKLNPGFKGVFMLGYDTGSKSALNLSYDNVGTASLAVAPNAAGESVTFLGESYINGMKAKTRETMSKKGPKEVEHKFEADLGKGFQLMGTDACKK
jgi:hypothetical protein